MRSRGAGTAPGLHFRIDSTPQVGKMRHEKISVLGFCVGCWIHSLVFGCEVCELGGIRK